MGRSRASMLNQPKTAEQVRSSYNAVMQRLLRRKVPFMIGGAFAMKEYADIIRDTKDLDVFCLARDHPIILQTLSELGYATEVSDPDWIAKGIKDDILVDVIWGTGNRVHKVNEETLARAESSRVFDVDVKLLPPEEMILFKIYVQERDRFDGADINHIIRKRGPKLDWRHLLRRMDADWEVLFGQLLNFRFVYPSERTVIPEWLLRELIGRLQLQLSTPLPKDRVCRGPILAYTQYRIDQLQWGYRT